MPSTYSQDLRIELIAAGEQSGTWGLTTNNNLGNLIEDAISGAVVVTIDPGAGVQQAITAANGAIDQARCSALILQGATDDFEIFAPPVTKIYVIRNECSFQATLWCATTINGTTAPVGASGYIIPANKTVLVHSPDGVQFYDALNYLNSALPANSGGTGFQTYAVGDLLYANTTTSLAKLPDVATGNVLRSGGVNTAPAWGKVNLATDVTGDLPVANLGGGTGASNTTFWRGDGTWQSPGGGGDVSFTGTAPTASVNQVAVYGATGTSITTGRTYQFRATTAGQAQIQLFENATGGATDSITIQTPNTITSSYTLTLPTSAGTNGYVLQTNGSGTLSWVAQPTVGSGTVTSVASGNGMNFTTITGTGTVTMGTPSAITSSSTNSVSASSHTHEITGAAFLAGSQTFTGAKTFNAAPTVAGIVSSTGAYNFTATNESIFGSAGSVTIAVGNAGRTNWTASAYTPVVDAAITLGTASLKWGQIYSNSGTINTSDANEKQDIADLDDAEKRVAMRLKGLIKKFRFRDAVVKKGDAARIHVGVIAQEVQAAFAAEGLDANRYGIFCSDTWWEREEDVSKPYTFSDETDRQVVVYETPIEGAVEKTRLGVRYEELLAFVIAAM
jgi:hypothetical protein